MAKHMADRSTKLALIEPTLLYHNHTENRLGDHQKSSNRILLSNSQSPSSEGKLTTVYCM